MLYWRWQFHSYNGIYTKILRHASGLDFLRLWKQQDAKHDSDKEKIGDDATPTVEWWNRSICAITKEGEEHVLRLYPIVVACCLCCQYPTRRDLPFSPYLCCRGSFATLSEEGVVLSSLPAGVPPWYRLFLSGGLLRLAFACSGRQATSFIETQARVNTGRRVTVHFV